jgi:hypothetical protein
VDESFLRKQNDCKSKNFIIYSKFISSWLYKILLECMYFLQLKINNNIFVFVLPLFFAVAKDRTISVASAFSAHQQGNLPFEYLAPLLLFFCF